MAVKVKNINHIYTLDTRNNNLFACCLDFHGERTIAELILDTLDDPEGFSGKLEDAFSHAISASEKRESMVEYLKLWLTRMKQKCSSIESDGDDAVWAIVYPGERNDENSLEDFVQVFLDAGYANPIVVTEDLAAAAYFRKTVGSFEDVHGEEGILCTDFGAHVNTGIFLSPTSMTSVKSYVGASLINQMIVMVNLRDADRYIKRKLQNSRTITEDILKQFQRNPKFRDLLFQEAHGLKEEYFNKKSYGELPSGGVTAELALDDAQGVNGLKKLYMHVNTNMIEDIITKRPIREVLGEELFAELPPKTRDEIGNNSWKDCLVNFLIRIADTVPEFKGTDENCEAVVLLGGGAAQMDFIEPAVYDIYPNVSVEMDLISIQSIALGLGGYVLETLRKCSDDTEINHALFLQATGEKNQEQEEKETGDSHGAQEMHYAGTALPETKVLWSIPDSLKKADYLIGYVNKINPPSKEYPRGSVEVLFSGGKSQVSQLTLYRNGKYTGIVKLSNALKVGADGKQLLSDDGNYKAGDVIVYNYFNVDRGIRAEKKDNHDNITIVVKINERNYSSGYGTDGSKSTGVSWDIPAYVRRKYDSPFGYVTQIYGPTKDHPKGTVKVYFSEYCETFYLHRYRKGTCLPFYKISESDWKTLRQCGYMLLDDDGYFKVGDLLSVWSVKDSEWIEAKMNPMTQRISLSIKQRPCVHVVREDTLLDGLRIYYVKIDGEKHLVRNKTDERIYINEGRHTVEVGGCNMATFTYQPLDSAKDTSYHRYELSFLSGEELVANFSGPQIALEWK